MSQTTTRANSAQSAEDAGAISLVLNGETIAAQAETLADLIVRQAYAGQRIATAVNGEFVPERARAFWRLSPGDRIEIVSARQGG